MPKRKKEHQFNAILIDESIPLKRNDSIIDLSKLRIDYKFKNKSQKEFINLIENNQITICSGPAGVGKSYLSVAIALDLLKTGIYKKIHLITPAVEAGEKLGFLPGDLLEKLQPYLYSTYYLFDKLIGKANRMKLISNGYIEPLAISFLRGVNIDNSILIFEEAQNSSITTMKTILTRIGSNSKFIISGDLGQIDNDKIVTCSKSGLQYALNNLCGIDQIGIFKFTDDDINVRNPLITAILNKF
jgi:phosphate starvation-inducible PhoH-like protein